jgi:pantoate--beta-alanine ligase
VSTGTSSAALPVVRKIAALRTQIAAWRQAGDRIALVPTMGALHDGHLALVRRALAENDRVAVSIFVNPTQFGPNEDFASYPRDESADVAKLQPLGVHLVWAPEPDEMYPPGFATAVRVAALTEHLDGPHRPGHFDGVATAVTKLLRQVEPHRAYFGEKDYQQLRIVNRLTRDLDLGVEIVGVPTVRDHDGLALSSRNAYLSTQERERAALLPLILARTAAAAAAATAGFVDLLNEARDMLTDAGFGPIDYIQIGDAETLAPVDSLERPARIFVAARMGKTRLIDNMPVPSGNATGSFERAAPQARAG